MYRLRVCLALALPFAIAAASCTERNTGHCDTPTAEDCTDGLDNDCDGLVDYDDLGDCRLSCGGACPPVCDADRDNLVAKGCGGTDCNDHDATVGPGKEEICDDGVDNNCDGKIDTADPGCPEDPPDCDSSAGKLDPRCTKECLGSVDIELAITPSKVLACDGFFCGPSKVSVSIIGPDGVALRQSVGCAEVECGRCQFLGCPGAACGPPTVVAIETPLRVGWDGMKWEQSSCSSAAYSGKCSERRCAAAGSYTARVCVQVAGEGLAEGETCHEQWKSHCTDLVFDYPTTKVVKGELKLAESTTGP